jgi:hypothetical protein
MGDKAMPDDDEAFYFQIAWSDRGKLGWLPEKYATEEEALAAAQEIEIEKKLDGTWSLDAYWDVAEVDPN